MRLAGDELATGAAARSLGEVRCRPRYEKARFIQVAVTAATSRAGRRRPISLNRRLKSATSRAINPDCIARPHLRSGRAQHSDSRTTRQEVVVYSR
jgi:hypothetical protein